MSKYGSVPPASPRHEVVLLGEPPPLALHAVHAAVESARMKLTVESASTDPEQLLDGDRPAAILLDLPTCVGSEPLLGLRYFPRLANVPILGVTNDLSDLAFEEILSWGGDDLVHRGDAEGLARRLRPLSVQGDIPSVRARGIAVVAESDRKWRILTARALRNAGWSVNFAADVEETIREATNPSVDLVLSTSTFASKAGGVADLVTQARSVGSRAAWVFGAPPRETYRLRGDLRGVARVAIYDSYGPAENVLFVANDLLRSGASNARKSTRLLYGTTVRFRLAGTDTDELGYTYNLSTGGLYVRTLAPLDKGAEAWLELTPPRSDRRVRLEAKVVWERLFSPNDTATVPPGFGAQISGGSVGDLERYSRGYHAFAAELSAE